MALLTKKKWKIVSAGYIRLEDRTRNMVISELVKQHADDTVNVKTTPAALRNGVTKIFGLETVRSGDLHPPRGTVSAIYLNAEILEISLCF